jgi:hypothetical protein
MVKHIICFTDKKDQSILCKYTEFPLEIKTKQI